MVQSLKENKTLKNALDAMKNTPIPVAVRMVDTGIGMKLPYIESSTVGEVAGKFSKASTAAKDDAYQLAKGSGGSGVSKEGSVAKGTGEGSNTNPNKIKLTSEREKYYRMKIDEAKARGDYKAADDIRYDRHCEETKQPLERKDWDARTENLRKSQERGREEEIKGRKALGEHLDRQLEDNNAGEVVTYTSSEGHLTRPDSIGRNDKGEIDLVHDHKHKMGEKEQTIHNDRQMRAEREMLEDKNGSHVVSISSDKPDLNGIPPKPRPSGPLGKDSDVYYTDPNSGKVTHKWENSTRLPGGGRWKKL